MTLRLHHQGTYIAVRTSFVGFHCWPSAPEPVAFLRDRHRHVFHVELTMPVRHDDRDVEFTLVKIKLDELLAGLARIMTTESCEQIGNAVVVWAADTYKIPGRYVAQVYEDGENGAMTTGELVEEP